MSPGAVRAPAPAGWHWRHLLIAPHRLAFLLAMLVLAAASSWWATVQLDRVGAGPGLAHAVSPSLVHAAVMTFGFMPLFFAGFLFTAGPKWLAVRGPPAGTIAPALLAQCAGWLLWLAGSHVAAPLAIAGLALATAGLGSVAVRFLRLVAASRQTDRVHARTVGAALVAGCLCLAGVIGAMAAGSEALARLFVLTGLWGFVVVVFVAVAHRMIPFFATDSLPSGKGIWRWFDVFWLMVGIAVFEAVAGWLDATAGDRPAWQLARGLVELGAGAVLAWQAIAWGLVRSLKIRLLAMLHLGFLWFGLSLLLGGLAELLGWAAGTRLLPLASLHALTMGCLGSLMLAQITRVTCAHSGRPGAVPDGLVWGIFLLLQAATILRIAATVPAWPGRMLLVAAALAWAGPMLIWGGRYAGWYGRPSAGSFRG